MNQSEIRKIYKSKRLKLTKENIETKSKIISNNFIKNLLPKISNFKVKKIGFYFASYNEVNPICILKHCQNIGNITSLPFIEDKSNILKFKRYKINDPLSPNLKYKKIFEPEINQADIIPDIIFVPLVAFDKKLNRIGMGGGFYDKTIQHYHNRQLQTLFIGLGYDWQECDNIYSKEHDQKLDYIISETKIL